MRLIACLLGLGLLLAGCDRQKPDGPQGGGAPSDWAGPRLGQGESAGRLDRSHAGTLAPASAFENPEGGPTTLADFQGKPLLVNLWATWCAPCIAEMPTLDALAAREDKLQVLVVSQDLDGQDKVDAFFAERNFSTLQPHVDPQLGLMTALGVDTLPTTILYDAEGREVWRMTGIEDWQGARAAELIAEARPAA